MRNDGKSANTVPTEPAKKSLAEELAARANELAEVASFVEAEVAKTVAEFVGEVPTSCPSPKQEQSGGAIGRAFDRMEFVHDRLKEIQESVGRLNR